VRATAVDAAAEALGLHPGLSLSDARARRPEVEVVEADPAGDAALLKRMAEAARRWSPVVALDAPDGLLLDVSGCAHLWGGEESMLADAARRMRVLGFSVRLGLADTPGLAWAVARYGERPVAPGGARREPLETMPTAALRIPSETVQALARVGVRTVGQVMDKPRGPLARRYGAALLLRLDQATGLRAEPLKAEQEVPPHRVEQRLFEPVVSEAGVLAFVERLAEALKARLDGEGVGGRRFGLELFRVDGAVKRLEVACSRPLAEPRRIAALFAERIASLNDGLEADYGFDVLRLWALKVQPLKAATGALDGMAVESADAELDALADRLAVRLGDKAVTRLKPGDRREPERACRAVPYAEAEPSVASWAAEVPAAYQGTPLRPLKLFRRPEPVEAVAEAPDGPPLRFTWRRVARRVAKAEGPERIAPDWSEGRAGRLTRDYWRLEDDQGRRYWVFRHGLYEETDAPRWWVHGLFP